MLHRFILNFAYGIGAAAYLYVGAGFMANAVVGPINDRGMIAIWERWCYRHNRLSVTISVLMFVTAIASFAAVISSE